MLTSNDATNTPERDFAIREIHAIASIRLWDPGLYDGLLQVARLYTEPHTLDFEGVTSVDAESVAVRRRDAERYIDSRHFGACPIDFQPTMTFADGRRLAWPELTLHKCAPEPSQPRRVNWHTTAAR
jgi:hypothetical protein